MKTIYLVEGYRAYEGSGVVRAFTLKKDAEAFCKKCEKIALNEPDDLGPKWTAWHKKHKAIGWWPDYCVVTTKLV